MSEKKFAITINGKEYDAVEGQKILEVARAEDVFIPGVCYHPDLGTIQTCDTCYVMVDGQLTRSCTMKAEPGMKVDTMSEGVKAAQYEAMSRILKNHELYCTVRIIRSSR
jgi:formate dehydrogenase major subunit